MDDRTLARWRVHTLRLCGTPAPAPVDVVRCLLAVQAENYPQAGWAVACRTVDCTEASFGRSFDDGAILRTHVLRPTWHFVLPEDLGWLVAVTAPRAGSLFARQLRDLEVDERTLEAAVEAVAEVLADGQHRTRDELGAELDQRRLPAQGQRLGLVLGHAENRGLVCSGRRKGTKQTYALVTERAPQTRRMDEDQALAELAWRYFSGHGPATERDLAYWATLSLAEVRRGLAAAADRLSHLDHDGRRYWFAAPPPDGFDCTPRAHLLQILDEYYRGYQDSRYILDAEGLVPGGRAATIGMALVDGQMVGEMRRTVRRDRVRFDMALYRTLAADEHAAIRAAADRYGSFLGLEAEVVTGPAEAAPG